MWGYIQGSKSKLTAFLLFLLLLTTGSAYGEGLQLPSTPIEMSNKSIAFVCCSINFLYIVSLIVIPIVVIGFILLSLYKAETRRQQEMKNPLTVLYTGVLAGGGIVLGLRIIIDTLESFGVPVAEYLKLFYLGFIGSDQIANFSVSYLYSLLNEKIPACCLQVPNSASIEETMFYILALALLTGHVTILFSTIGSVIGFAWKGAVEAYRILKYEEDWREAFYRFITYTVLGLGVSFFIVYILQVLYINPYAIANGWLKYILFP